MNSTNRRIKKVILPRDYLSWSQYSTFKRNREEYIRHYFFGEPGIESPAMEFGHSFAKNLEARAGKNAKANPDPVIEMALQAIPRLKSPEFHLSATLPSKYGQIPIIGTLDDYDPKTHDFNEFKTGTRKWTQRMANEHGQLKFYQLMLWLNHNVLKNKKNLIWIETENTDGEIMPTGKIVKFPVEISLPSLLNFSRDVIEVAHEIEELYKEIVNQSIQ
jgi:hypothetical protein